MNLILSIISVSPFLLRRTIYPDINARHHLIVKSACLWLEDVDPLVSDHVDLPLQVTGGGNMRMRVSDPNFLAHLDRWLDVLLPKVAKFLYIHGGPILMVQARPWLSL